MHMSLFLLQQSQSLEKTLLKYTFKNDIEGHLNDVREYRIFLCGALYYNIVWICFEVSMFNIVTLSRSDEYTDYHGSINF